MDVRLKSSSGMFYDPETGFIIQNDETKTLPSKMGSLTRRWVNAGGLVKVSPTLPVEVAVKPENENSGDVKTYPHVDKSLEVQRYIDAFDRKELMRLCKDRGIVTGRYDKKVTLATKLASGGIDGN